MRRVCKVYCQFERMIQEGLRQIGGKMGPAHIPNRRTGGAILEHSYSKWNKEDVS